MTKLGPLARLAVAAVIVLTATTAVAHYGAWTAVLAFVLATLALAGLAWLVAIATEQVGEHLGPAATGLLQASVGNLPELFVVIFALRAGERVVAQSAIVGSLFANSLLVLGIVLIVGALRRGAGGVMRFDPRITRATATMLFVCLFAIVLVALSLASGGAVAHHVDAISVIAAALLLTVYLSWIVPHVRGERRGEAPLAAKLSLASAVALLLIAGTASGFVSDWFVDALRPAIGQLHISPAFAGLVIVALAGNAVENAVGISLAAKGRSDLAISVVVSSVAQIAAFLFPLLVLISFAFHTHLTFALPGIYIGALALSAVAVWQITDDGEARVFEGWALIAIYAILAVIAIYE
ncbi:MAG: sodium:proton exchanger [Solirubrobacteraceae bacterium]|jgi:Ca2+:H+ antiporter